MEFSERSERSGEVERAMTAEISEMVISPEAGLLYDDLLGENEEAAEKSGGERAAVEQNSSRKSEAVIRFEKLMTEWDETGNVSEKDSPSQVPGEKADLKVSRAEIPERPTERDLAADYERNGSKYYLDDKSRIVCCKASPHYTEDGIRSQKDQMEAGGDERRADDDGGHIVGRVLGGAEGAENLVPMRRTINRGDYKKMENEIARSAKDGKEITMEVQMQYQDDSTRPSAIVANYKIEDRAVEAKFDNETNSLELLADVKSRIAGEDYRVLKQELDDMRAEGSNMTITSVKTEYDASGNPYRVTVGVLEEESGEKSYKVYEVR